MHIENYNPIVEFQFVSRDSNGLYRKTTLDQLINDFFGLAEVHDLVTAALQNNGVYYHPLHVRVGGSIGTAVVSLAL